MLEGVRKQNEVIIEVLQAAKLGHLWTKDGPTPVARAIRDGGGEGLEEAKRVWVLLAWELYDGSGKLPVARLMDTLDETQLPIALSMLLRVAMGQPGLESILESGGADPEGGAPVN